MRRKPSPDQLDLLAWSPPVHPEVDVIDFIERRESLPRWVLHREEYETRRLELRFERACGDPLPPVIALRRA